MDHSHLTLQPLIRKSLEEARQVLDRFLADEKNLHHIELAGKVMAEAITAGHKIISCGNGGSMCDAMHFAEELSGRFREDRRAVAAISISDPSHITCAANDYGFESIFSRYVEAIGQKGDVLLAISTSGRSGNVIKASEIAKEKGMKVVALTGKTGGELAGIADIEIRVDHKGYSDRIQEIHIKVIHILIEIIEMHL
ncbi:MAG TPA: D-sedoheptulose 7-phosphate isomerase [Bacteroidales bacterium]|nr:D-sedoheptulose 7-phosphate isomerase [Bacteroidales bacterium]HQH40970.1 D-sedoheptulose 7-phosphate isomerase [Bacteroidales bacterium]